MSAAFTPPPGPLPLDAQRAAQSEPPRFCATTRHYFAPGQTFPLADDGERRFFPAVPRDPHVWRGRHNGYEQCRLCGTRRMIVSLDGGRAVRWYRLPAGPWLPKKIEPGCSPALRRSPPRDDCPTCDGWRHLKPNGQPALPPDGEPCSACRGTGERSP